MKIDRDGLDGLFLAVAGEDQLDLGVIGAEFNQSSNQEFSTNASNLSNLLNFEDETQDNDSERTAVFNIEKEIIEKDKGLISGVITGVDNTIDEAQEEEVTSQIQAGSAADPSKPFSFLKIAPYFAIFCVFALLLNMIIQDDDKEAPTKASRINRQSSLADKKAHEALPVDRSDSNPVAQISEKTDILDVEIEEKIQPLKDTKEVVEPAVDPQPIVKDVKNLTLKPEENSEPQPLLASALEPVEQPLEQKPEEPVASRSNLKLNFPGTFKFNRNAPDYDWEEFKAFYKKILNCSGDILISGYTDSKGSATMNQKISYRRANIVKNMLVDMKIDEDRIKVYGRGEDSPISTNKTAVGREKNRRVVIQCQTQGV